MSLDRLESFIFEKISETRLPAVSAAVIQGQEVPWSRGFGFRSLEHGLPATPRTLYGIGSVTKSFTALAILQLAEQGRLSVDDPLDRFIPFTLRPAGEPVRLWHLMTHTSGLPALAYAERVISGVTGASEDWLPIASYQDMLTFLNGAQDWALSRPGERWFYLNEGYVLLGYVIEQVTGMPYTEYVRQHILLPLGMARSFFARADVEADPDAATPYVVADDGRRIPSTYAYGTITPDGGLISNVLDLANYVRMFLGWGEFQGARIISRPSLEAMQTPRIPTPEQEGPFGQHGYAYGLRITPAFLGHRLVAHGGSVGTATAYLAFIPEREVGIVLLANGSGYPLSQLGQYGLALLLGQDPDALPFARQEALLRRLEGVYETYRGTMRMQVRRSGDFLTLEERDRYNTVTVILVPESLQDQRCAFYTRSGGHKIPVEFRLEPGRVSLLYERYLLRRTGGLTS